jgi:hypothetical protein
MKKTKKVSGHSKTKVSDKMPVKMVTKKAAAPDASRFGFSGLDAMILHPTFDRADSLNVPQTKDALLHCHHLKIIAS